MGTAPDPTGKSRTNPTSTGYVQMDDGHSTLLIIDADPDIPFWEKTVKPPGVDGGDPIETSTMHNSVWRTQVSRSLKTMTPCNLTAAYDPEIWCLIPDQVNAEGLMVVVFPNGDLVGFYGFLQSFEPQDHLEGAQPECDIVIAVTNNDPSDRSEQAPVWTTSSGTGCS